MKIKKIFLPAIFALIYSSCANQLPPSGGEDDRTPPEILQTRPKANTLNFKGNSISFKFNEYVDRRSFEESFNISPLPSGETIFNWSGKEVEINFSKPFEKNRTYVVTLNRDLKDLRGGNKANTSYSFAFSTGSKLDSGKIRGRVYTDKIDRIKILAYLKNRFSPGKIDPVVDIPAFISQPSEDGEYLFTNLPEGNFRLFAISDEDRNNLFGKEFELISVLPDDITLNADSLQFEDADFLMKNFGFNKSSKEFLNSLTSYSEDRIHTNISSGTGKIPGDYKFYFYFKDSNIVKSDIVNNSSITDTSTDKSYKLIYNWLNDSLLEIFSLEKFSNSSVINISIDLKETSKKLIFSEDLNVADRNSTGVISGKLTGDSEILFPVYIILLNNGNKFISYIKKLTDTKEFRFDDVAEGNYTLFSYIDENENGAFDNGSYFPFSGSEKFFVFGQELKVKGNWNTDNIFIEF